ncbi:MAG: ATP-binding protein [Alphaproteobacteria bacterium]
MTGLNTFWFDHPTDDSAEAQAIRAAQIDIARRQTVSLAAGNIVNGSLVAWVLWPVEPKPVVAAWLAVILFFSFWRLAVWLRQRGKPQLPSAGTPRTVRRALALTIGGSLLWGIAAAGLFPTGSLPLQTFLAIVVAGVSAGTATMMSCLPAAAIGALVLITGPMVVRMLMEGTQMHYALAAMMTLFVIVMLAASRSFYGTLVENVRTRIANAELLQAVRGARADLLDAIETISNGFALFDAEDRLVVSNPRYGEMLDIPSEKLVPGTPFEDLLYGEPAPPPGPAPAEADWKAARIHRHREAQGTFEQELSSGRWLRSSDFRTSRGGIVTVHVDITAIKRREQQLRAAMYEAESANRAKSDFLALVSHELRTPLNAVLGFAEILRDETFGKHADARYGEYANDIYDSGAHLLQVINDILDLSKIEAGRLQLNEEEVSLPEVADDLERVLGGMLGRGQLTLRQDLPAGLPHLWADGRAMKQILMNLLSNAIKFTPAGGVITLRGRRRGDELEVAVQDTGIGIPADQLDKVLEPFGQASDPLTREFQGSGLGLTLVRSLTELHGGSLRLDSEEGVGTTVWLTFPSERVVPSGQQSATGA